jgi:PAS domain-containing protein
MRKGAYDFVTKPLQLDSLLLTIERAGDGVRREKRSGQSEDEIVQTLLDLNTERKRLKTIVSRMASGVLVTDWNLEVIFHNRALLHMLGVKEEMKNPCLDPVDREDLLLNICSYLSCLFKGLFFDLTLALVRAIIEAAHFHFRAKHHSPHESGKLVLGLQPV